ncbi:MAG TPA: hypothetical protein PLO67_09960 [Saprospiraceae bacterium]|nr:hypothetical protein [Saprospiraceae bacterium]HPI06229.1 hypothetical protein [Saprospiraceae bacterium]
MEELNYFEKIDDYLNGRLTEADRIQFEQQLLEDADLRENLDLYRDLRKVTAEPEVEDLRQKMARWSDTVHLGEDQPATEKTAPPPMTVISAKRYRKWWQAAAAVFVLAVGAVYWFQTGSKATPDQLFAVHFTTPRTITVSGYRGDIDTAAVARILQQVEAAYQKKDYAGVITIYDQLVHVTSYSNEAHRGKAIAYLALGNGLQAESELKQIDAGFEEDRAWYGAMALLLQKDKTQMTIEAFERFAANSDFQSDRRRNARAIARQLK